MKRTERHQLKDNELAGWLSQAVETLVTHQREFTVAIVVFALLAGGGLGYAGWRSRRNDRAAQLYAQAMAVADARVVPPGTETRGQPPAPGSYPTERAKLEASLGKFKQAADAFPATPSGLAARYHEAATLVALDRAGEAVAKYQDVVSRAGDGIYGQMARMGLAAAQARTGQWDIAISAYRELLQKKDGPLPLDALLIELGQVQLNAGKTADAQQTLTRLIDEFPGSPFMEEARRTLGTMKKKNG